MIGIGRIKRGRVKRNMPIIAIDRLGKSRRARILDVLCSRGLAREPRDEALAGDIVYVTGVENIAISDTLCAPDTPEALPPLSVDEPTLTMLFCVNTSPFAGLEGASFIFLF